MNRPEKIYLDEPIIINGVEIRHTLDGLLYLVDHMTHCLAIASNAQINHSDREHAKLMIDKYKRQIQIYEQRKQ
ncbi:MAG: hypothetical protein WDO15_11265 [Bacteroidota bacterium]